MVSTLNLEEKYNQIRRKFCFYLDIQDHGLARSISRRLGDMGLQQEIFLTPRVTHVVRDRPERERERTRWPRLDGRRADAMLERVRTTHTPSPQTQTTYTQLNVHKAIRLLDKLYDTFTAPHKANVRVFNKHFIKIEFLDKICRPVYKEFDIWPEISIEPNPPKEKKKETSENKDYNNINHSNQQNNTAAQKMTRKGRPRIKEKDDKETKGGYCEMCNTDYTDVSVHRRSPHHLAYIKDHSNFIALDTLIGAGADVSTFLNKASQPVNGERRSLRKICNGDVEPPKNKRSKRSQSPDSTVNGAQSPIRNGLEDERKHNTRCSKKSDSQSEDRQYYKVVDVSTKLRSSGGFARRKESPPTVNGSNKPLVVKFRKVRRSELSVLSDEAEQFMFPKRASSTSSTSSDDEKEYVRRKSSPQPPQTLERRRLARPLALKEESSEEDCWPEDKRKRKRRTPAIVRRTRRTPIKTPAAEEKPPYNPEPAQQESTQLESTQPEIETVSPLREEPVERCMKWEGGKLKYTPAVDQLEFAFESVPQSEPWFETFKRQDEDKLLVKNVPQYFALYINSPKLPYEIGQLPPLKPNCCPLSDLVKREEKPGPSRSYGTRGMKKQRIRKRTDAVIALEGHPRKSPREHASTLAILGSAGLLNRRKNAEDAKSTASEDTVSETHSNMKVEPVLSETQEASERLQQFLSEVFEDAAEYDISEEAIEGEPAVVTSTAPDVLSLVSECEDCNIIENEIKESAVNRTRYSRGKFKKNRTGWPTKRKYKKTSRTDSAESTQKADSSIDRSSLEMPDEDTRDLISEEETIPSETEVDNDKTLLKSDESQDIIDADDKSMSSDDRPLRLDVKVLLEDKKEKVILKQEEKQKTCESEEKDQSRKKKRSVQGIGNWLQPVVRVARVDPNAARRLRSAGRSRVNRFR